jgi:hypothetical protein
MNRLILFLLVALCALLPTMATPAAAAPAATNSAGCVPFKHLTPFASPAQLEAAGFRSEIIGPQASLAFEPDEAGGHLALDVASDPQSSTYTAARITEVDSQLPIDQRVKCWQPTGSRNVVVEYSVRFAQPSAQPGMTENLILWNAPFPSQIGAVGARPVTAVGMSRLGGMYFAAVAQDFDNAIGQGLFSLTPLPAWLQPTDWHRVRVTLTTRDARVELAQGERPYTTVAAVALLHQPEPLAFEFSVDNDAGGGITVPVNQPDGLDARCLVIRAAPVELPPMSFCQ